MKGWGKVKSIDNISNRLGRLEKGTTVNQEIVSRPYATAEELEQMTDEERFEAWFNWRVREIMPYYKAEVMHLHNISDDEYDRRTLEGDQSIYLPAKGNQIRSSNPRGMIKESLMSSIYPTKNCNRNSLGES